MSIAVFMVLVQLRIAPEIVLITYGALMFALALGAALAFGLGGRDVAGRILHNAYQNTDIQAIRRDVQTGKDRTGQQDPTEHLPPVGTYYGEDDSRAQSAATPEGFREP
jgi:hypothetical protein